MGVEIFERIGWHGNSYVVFSRDVLYFIVINNVFHAGYGNRIDLSNMVCKLFDYSWDVERGVKVILYDSIENKMLSFRYRITYLDFSSQFLCIFTGGVILALVCKRINRIVAGNKPQIS
ncbi:hypothetical protein ECANGB1_2340 [Enterospora canceri]|uniref:Uncharacterized protein n=1 Tax=Enterospora canceri TaxID=1081671 RepID=A0A1Y1S9C9_9MICR|nr:hypothetical protein ECANGB1_2340 [Enterospora canceri]